MTNPIENKRILLGVTGSIACYKAADLASKLRQAGAEVDVVPVYRTVVPEETPERLRQALEQGVDCVTFTSSSTVRNFLGLLPGGDLAPLAGVTIACIRPITADTARGAGLNVAVQPASYTIDGLFEAILSHYSG